MIIFLIQEEIMKKKDVINLIRYYTEGNDAAFRDQAYAIAHDFYNSGDEQIGSYILALLSDSNTFVPQEVNERTEFFEKAVISNHPLPLPEMIYQELIGIVNASSTDPSINKFLFEGPPGTGKTESAKHLARIMERELYIVDTDSIIDSHLGQTAKNIASLFSEISALKVPEKVIILFDELDALAMDRTDSHDIREMGRATTAFLKGLDNLHTSAVILATTNLASSFDKALLRRFDAVVNFSRYSDSDLLEVADVIYSEIHQKFRHADRNTRLLHKILQLKKPIPYPGELRNLIRTAVAFSNPEDGKDWFRRLFMQIMPDYSGNIKELKDDGFTLREIEILSDISKSQASRLLKRGEHE